MTTAAHLPILRRTGRVLLVIGVVDIAVLVACMAQGIPYPSSFNIVAVVGGIFLLRGSLRAAMLVRRLSLSMLSLVGEGAALSSSGPLRGFAVPVLFAAPAYARPATAPNGQSWPDHAGYVAGYPLLGTEGTGRITVDNSHNDSDAFVKLVAQRDGQPQVVRHLYVPAHQRFTAEQLVPGTYDLRYRNLASGALARTPSVNLPMGTDAPPAGGGAPVTVLLYREPQGKEPALRLAEKEFF